MHKSAKIISSHNVRDSSNLSLCDRISLTSLCTDPDCTEANIDRRDNRSAQLHLSSPNINHNDPYQNRNNNNNNNDGQRAKDDNVDEEGHNRKDSIDSTELLISTKMTAPSSEENLLDNCGSNCQHNHGSGAVGVGAGGGGTDNDYGFCDPLMNQEGYCTNGRYIRFVKFISKC